MVSNPEELCSDAFRFGTCPPREKEPPPAQKVLEAAHLAAITSSLTRLPRNDHAAAHSKVRQWGLTSVEPLFERLVEICNSASTSWKSKEGALLAITNIIRKFRWATSSSPIPPPTDAGRAADGGASAATSGESAATATKSTTDTAFRLKFGPNFIAPPGAPGLPDFVTSGFRTMVYEMLAHKQLSIRDSAAKAFSAYLARSQYQEVLMFFAEIVERLRRKTPDATAQKAATDETLKASRTTSASTSTLTAYGFCLLDDYEAEGLLGVCLFIIKHLQPGFLLPNWPLYFSTFSSYLSHKASTVRQATSSVFKYIVAKDGSNPTMLKLVLQGLAANWFVADIHGKPDVATDEQSWEWKEGRLFAYELILKFLLTNHVHYLFPTSLVGKARAIAGKANRASAHATRRLSLDRGSTGSILGSGAGGGGNSAGTVVRGNGGGGGGLVEATPQRTNNPRPGHHASGSQTEPRGSTRTPRPKSARATTSSRSRTDVLGLSLDARLERPRSDDRPATNPEVSIEDPADMLGPPQFDLYQKKESFDARGDAGSRRAGGGGGGGGPEVQVDTDLAEAAAAASLRAGGGAAAGNRRRTMRRSPSFRTAGLQKHIEKISAVTPDQPFKHGRVMSASPARVDALGSRLRTASMSGNRRGRALSLLSQVVELDTNTTPGPYSPPVSPATSPYENTKTSFEKSLEAPIWVPFSESLGHGTPPEAATAVAVDSPVTPAAKLLKPPDDGPTRLLSPGWLGEDESPAWVDTSRFEPFQSILCIMFVQTAESLASTRFEVRRMAKMVLPLLTEVVHWYQPGLLDDIWSTCFPAGPTTWLYHAGVFSVRQSLIHVGNLLTSFGRSLGGVGRKKDADFASAVNDVVRSVEMHVEETFPFILKSAWAPEVDRLRVSCIEIILLVETSLPHLIPDTHAEEFETAWPMLLGHVFSLTHGDACGLDKLKELDPDSELVVSFSDAAGSASAAAGGSDTGATAAAIAAAQKAAFAMLLESTFSYAPEFVDRCDLQTALQLLPVFVHLGCSSQVDDATSKAAMEAAHRIVDRAGDQLASETLNQEETEEEAEEEAEEKEADGLTGYFDGDGGGKSDDDTEDRHDGASSFDARFSWLQTELEEAGTIVLAAALPHLNADGSDHVSMKRIIAILRTLCLAISQASFFTQILTTVAQAAAQQPSIPKSVIEVHEKQAFLNQLARGSPLDIRETLGTSSDSEGEDSQAEGVPDASADAASDSESDWDESEDEEGTDGITPVLADFVVNLQFIASQARTPVDFEKIVAMLPERGSIQWLLENGGGDSGAFN